MERDLLSICIAISIGIAFKYSATLLVAISIVSLIYFFPKKWVAIITYHIVPVTLFVGFQIINKMKMTEVPFIQKEFINAEILLNSDFWITSISEFLSAITIKLFWGNVNHVMVTESFHWINSFILLFILFGIITIILYFLKKGKNGSSGVKLFTITSISIIMYFIVFSVFQFKEWIPIAQFRYYKFHSYFLIFLFYNHINTNLIKEKIRLNIVLPSFIGICIILIGFYVVTKKQIAESKSFNERKMEIVSKVKNEMNNSEDVTLVVCTSDFRKLSLEPEINAYFYKNKKLNQINLRQFQGDCKYIFSFTNYEKAKHRSIQVLYEDIVNQNNKEQYVILETKNLQP